MHSFIFPLALFSSASDSLVRTNEVARTLACAQVTERLHSEYAIIQHLHELESEHTLQ